MKQVFLVEKPMKKRHQSDSYLYLKCEWHGIFKSLLYILSNEQRLKLETLAPTYRHNALHLDRTDQTSSFSFIEIKLTTSIDLVAIKPIN